jgi:hypothetical protein
VRAKVESDAKEDLPVKISHLDCARFLAWTMHFNAWHPDTVWLSEVAASVETQVGIPSQRHGVV